MAAQDLTDLATVREALDAVAGETDSDDLIGSYITRASVAIMRYAGREFAPTTDATERRFVVAGRIVDLAPYDLRSVDSVELHPLETTPTTLTSSEYLLEPIPAVDGVYTRVRLSTALDLSADSTTDFGRTLVDITGDWGWATIPDDVEHATIATVLSWLRRDATALEGSFTFDDSSGGLAPRPTGTFGLPRSVRVAIDRYRRMVVV